MLFNKSDFKPQKEQTEINLEREYDGLEQKESEVLLIFRESFSFYAKLLKKKLLPVKDLVQVYYPTKEQIVRQFEFPNFAGKVIIKFAFFNRAKEIFNRPKATRPNLTRKDCPVKLEKFRGKRKNFIDLSVAGCRKTKNDEEHNAEEVHQQWKSFLLCVLCRAAYYDDVQVVVGKL